MIKLLKRLLKTKENKRNERIEAKTKELINKASPHRAGLTSLRINKDTDLAQLKKDLNKKGLDVNIYNPKCLVCEDEPLSLASEEVVQKVFQMKGIALYCEKCKFIAATPQKPVKKFLDAFCPKDENEEEPDKKAPDGGFLN